MNYTLEDLIAYVEMLIDNAEKVSPLCKTDDKLYALRNYLRDQLEKQKECDNEKEN